MKKLLLIIIVLLCPLVAQNKSDPNIKDEIFTYRKDKILPKYREGKFSILQKEIRTKKNQARNLKLTIFLTIWEAKIAFCLGDIDKAENIKNNLKELTESYKSSLLHEPTSERIYSCRYIIKNDECLCTIGGLESDKDNLDFFDEIDDHFFDMYLFFQKRDIKSIKTDDESDKLSFNDLYYPVEYKSSIRYDLINDVTMELYFLNEAPTKTPKSYDYDNYLEFEINSASVNRIEKKLRNKKIDLKFDNAYKSRNYTTNSLRYLPKFDFRGNPIKGFILIADSPDFPHYRYYFEFDDEVENDNSEKIVPIFWPKTKNSGDRWQIVPEGELNKIRLLIHEKYDKAIELYFKGNEPKNINDYIEDEAIYVDSALDSLSSKKWEKLAKEEVFRTKEVEITLSDETQDEQLNITLTNEYNGYDKEKRKRFISKVLIAVGISLNLILSFM